MDEHKGWYRRNLPHLDAGGITQSITFRLFDSLPKEALAELEEELKSTKGNIDRVRHERIEFLLDQGSGSCILREERCARIVQDSLLFLHEKKFDLRAWVVMPNHVHFLAHFEEGQSQVKALHSFKSFTAHEIAKIHPENVPVWQEEGFDRYIRNEDHYWDVVNYIHQNPVVAKLCKESSDFRWSSASLERS